MKIIIVGCGKVGSTLAEQLCREDTDITVLDTNGELVQQLVEEYDIMGYVGSGISIDTLIDAGIKKADMLIAVTDSDEVNLMCCLIARKASKCKTIARVRNPEYTSEIEFLKQEIGLAMVINPEYAAASEIARVLRLPSAIDVEVFAKGKVEILKFKVGENSVLCNTIVQDIPTKLKSDILVCVVERGNEVIIPDGSFVLQEKDVLYIAGTHANTSEFFRMLGIEKDPVRNIMIIGAGKISFYLCKMLIKNGVNVKVIERDPAACDKFCQLIPESTVILGDGSDKALLEEEGLKKTDAFAALTGKDEENVFFSLYAKQAAGVKTITKINQIEFDEVIDKLDLDTVIFPKEITAEYIVRYARAFGNSLGCNVETLHRIAGGKVEALEFGIAEDSPVLGKAIRELSLKKNILIACIQRGEQIFFPRGNDEIQNGDSVVVITTQNGLRDIKDILK